MSVKSEPQDGVELEKKTRSIIESPLTPPESVKDEFLGAVTPTASQVKAEEDEAMNRNYEIIEKLLQQSGGLKRATTVNKNPRSTVRKPKLKYRPANGTVLNLHDYNKKLSLESQDDHIDNEDVSFLHYAFKHSRKMVVVSGAGTSVASGIPDFRSANGLFQEYSKDAGAGGNGKQLFDYNVFRTEDATKKFQSMIKKLYQVSLVSKPTKFHKFIDAISADKRLLRLYTQNIDCLDTQLENLYTVAPLKKLSKVIPPTIQVHGNIQLLSCSKCQYITDMDPKHFDNLENDEEGTNLHPPCPECKELNEVRAIAGKRLQSEGILRPRIVLYNEFHPDGEIIGDITAKDLKTRPDCLVVVGTTLKIPGVRRLVKEMAKVVHSNKGYVIWINIDEPSISLVDYVEHFDLIVCGDCQDVPDIVAQYEQEFIQSKIIAKEQKASLKAKAKVTSPKKVTKPKTAHFKTEKGKVPKAIKEEKSTVTVKKEVIDLTS